MKIPIVQTYFFLICVTLPQVALSAEVTYNVGSHTFVVPKNNIPDLSPWGWIKSVAGLDEDVDSFIFEFAGEDIQPYVKGYVPEKNSIDQKVIGAIYHVDSIERARFYDVKKYADIWYANHGYDAREVVRDQSSGYYLVYEKEGYRGTFYVFSKPPEGAIPGNKEDFLVASCSGSSVTELKHVGCSKQFLLDDDLMVDFSISLENLKSQGSVTSFLEEKFAEWETQIK